MPTAATPYATTFMKRWSSAFRDPVILITAIVRDACNMAKKDARQVQLDLERLELLRAEREGLAVDIASIGELPEGDRRDVLNIFGAHAARLDDEIAQLEGELADD